MFRLFGIALVVVAFGATLYYSGDTLEAWESPEPSAKAAPDAQKKGKSKKRKARARRQQAARRASKPPTTWVAQMNTLCRRGQAEAEAVPVPLTPEGLPDYFRQLARVNKRWNRRAVALLDRGASRDPEAARGLVRLLGEEEGLMAELTSAVERGQDKRFEQLRPRIITLGRSESRLLKRLGARGCTQSEDSFRL
jgi:hypothetical protein